MGKKRIVKKEGESAGGAKGAPKGAKRKVASGTLSIQATYNNTKILLADKNGNCLAWGSSGMMGFRGAKKGTPFAAAKVAEQLGETAQQMGMKEVNVVVRGVGSGREASIRSFAAKGIEISSIKDATPVAHNGPKPRKPRHI